MSGIRQVPAQEPGGDFYHLQLHLLATVLRTGIQLY